MGCKGLLCSAPRKSLRCATAMMNYIDCCPCYPASAAACCWASCQEIELFEILQFFTAAPVNGLGERERETESRGEIERGNPFLKPILISIAQHFIKGFVH